MNIQRWLVVDAKGSVRLAVHRPRMGVDEIGIRLEMSIPNALFTRPQIIASVTIADEAVRAVEIPATTVLRMEDYLKEATGVDFRLAVIPIEEPS